MVKHTVIAAVSAVVSLLLAAWPLAADAQWKWRDANGRITISDLPPPRGTPDQNILQRPAEVVVQRAEPASAAASGPAASPAPKVDAELEARRQAAEQAEAERMRSEAQQTAQRRAENCRNARAHLAALNTGQRIARFNAQGEREILDDKQRASEARRAQDVVNSDCG